MLAPQPASCIVSVPIVQVRRFSFGVVLATTMAVATFALTVFSVLAAQLIEEFGVARWQIGALGTASSLGGAVISPWLGRAADIMGGRRATVTTLAIAAVALTAVSAAPVFALLVVAAGLTGIAQGFSNPATNKLIALHVEPGRRGIVTGIKQSGVQFGTFLGGLLLPLFALWWGWRIAVVAFVAVPVAGFILAWLAVPHDPARSVHDTEDMVPGTIPPFIFRLAIYGFLLGAGGTAIFTYMPLFAQEVLGLSLPVAGAAVALMGLTGIVARISWARFAEISIGSVQALSHIARLAALAALLLIGSEYLGGWLIWVAAMVTGLSASSWNSVGMLAIIQRVPGSLAGRGSGIVLFGFLAGLGLGAPIFGWSVDRLGTYNPGWIVVILLFIAGWAVMRGAAAEA